MTCYPHIPSSQHAVKKDKDRYCDLKYVDDSKHFFFFLGETELWNEKNEYARLREWITLVKG